MEYKNVYFLGIGGIGMSALARYFLHGGYAVAGYDRTPSHLTGELEAEGAAVHYEDDVRLIPEGFLDPKKTMVVYTPAVPQDHGEYRYFREHGFCVEKRSQMLGHLAEGKYVMAVAGTHGKTTTSTMVAWLNRALTGGGSAFLGGISKNFGGNLVLGDGGRLYKGLGADMVPAMYNLCSKANLIVPNVTEAALLLGDPLPGVGSSEQAAEQAARLTRIAPQVVVTGVTGLSDGRCIGCVGAARGGQGYSVKTPLIPRMYHGTGDIFGAVLVGRILQGNVPQAAVQAAAAFVSECIRQTPEGTDERLGVWLEAALPKLMQQ